MEGVDEPDAALLEIFQIPGRKLEPVTPTYCSYLPIGRSEGSAKPTTAGHQLAVLVGRLPIKGKHSIPKCLVDELVDRPRQRGSTTAVRQNRHALADFAERDRRHIQVR